MVSTSELTHEFGIENIREFAFFKRAQEYYRGLADFRKEFDEDSRQTCRALGLELDDNLIEWVPRFNINHPTEGEHPIAALTRQFFIRVSEDRTCRSREIDLRADLNFQVWRQRQIGRCDLVMGNSANKQIVHAPVAFELSKGCSVGCWFCGISADSYRGYAEFERYQSDWQILLNLLSKLAGTANLVSFCYWGTDPFDNPDYERYIISFRERFGYWPQTTTAQAHKYLARTRALLDLTSRQDIVFNRFSILSKDALLKVFSEFSPQELLYTGLVMQQKEATQYKADAGRARGRSLRYAPTPPELMQSTIACVSGFLINLLDRSVSLVSPCPANSRHPNGYIVFHRFVYADAHEVPELIRETVERFCITEHDNSSRIALSEDFRLICSEGRGLSLRSAATETEFPDRSDWSSILQRIAEQPGLPVERLKTQLKPEGISPFAVDQCVGWLMQRGILEEDVLLPQMTEATL